MDVTVQHQCLPQISQDSRASQNASLQTTPSTSFYQWSSAMKTQASEFEKWEVWDTAELVRKLNQIRFPESVVKVFKDEGLTGEHLKYLTIDLMLMKNLTFKEILDILNFLKAMDYISSGKGGGKSVKIYNDPIHGHIEVNPACQAIIDTPQFQRLRFLKQLGMCYYVFPGAAHNRFEHSLGVYHLAGTFARILQQNQPELCITDIDILCVEIAGLCHDLGHGPFSHVFDDKFLAKINPQNTIKHEKAAVTMFEELITANSLDKRFNKFGLKEDDIIFIKELIGGPLKTTGKADWPYIGRKEDKAFLYEIVCNQRNGIDVNKWDYLARDCHHLGFHNNFDYARYMMFARVIEEDGELQICIRDKELANLYNMFYTRYTLDRYAYQHKVNCGLEIMVTDALVLANDYIKFKGEGKKMLNISECITDMKAYTELNDNVLFKILYFDNEDEMDSQSSSSESVYSQILFTPETNDEWDVEEASDNEEIVMEDSATNVSTSTTDDTEAPEPNPMSTKEQKLKQAKEIIERIFKRKLYKCVFESGPVSAKDINNQKDLDIKNIEQNILLKARNECNEINEMDFVVSTAYFDFGMKEEDPVEKLKVYTKNNPTEAKLLTKKEISRILGPVTYKEVVIRVYSRSLQEHIQKAIYLASKKWFSSWNYKVEMKQSEERPRKKPRMKPISPESLTTPENENLVR